MHAKSAASRSSPAFAQILVTPTKVLAGAIRGATRGRVCVPQPASLRYTRPGTLGSALAKAASAPEASQVSVTAVSSSKKEVSRDGFLKAAALSVATAIGGAIIAINIDKFSDPPCTVTGTCAAISDTMKALLIGTHLYTFLLIPASMYVFYDKLDELQEQRIRSPFTVMMGLSLVSVAIMGEIGWHIQQAWFYKEEYNVLNLSFYFFLNSGLAAWALGLRINRSGSDALTAASPFISQELQLARLALQAQLQAAAGTVSGSNGVESDPAMTTEAAAQSRQLLGFNLGFNLGDAADYFLLSVPALTLGLYWMGASQTDSKVPIYIMMSAVFTVLTWRFWKLLKSKQVLLFPLFSVGVNLGFIFLLDKYQTDAFLNPLFHILHDAAGTQLGVAIITVLTYTSPVLADPDDK